VSCVAFSQNARQSSLPGKNEPGAFCHALWEKAHGKGGAVRFRAKSAVPVVASMSDYKKMLRVLSITFVFSRQVICSSDLFSQERTKRSAAPGNIF
jgi:hypothetical protein